MNAAEIIKGLSVIGSVELMKPGSEVCRIDRIVAFSGFGVAKGLKNICDTNDMDIKQDEKTEEFVLTKK